MILDVASLNVIAGREAEFEAAGVQTRPIISAMPGGIAHGLQHGIGRSAHDVLLVRRQNQQGHAEGGCGASAYPHRKTLLHHFYEQFPGAGMMKRHSFNRVANVRSKPCRKP